MVIDSELLRKRVERLEGLPTLPSVANSLISLTNSPQTSATEVGDLISKDQALTSRVLKLVNSAYYGFPKQITTVNHAVVILGFSRVKNIVLAASVFGIRSQDQPQKFDALAFWRHCLGAAISARTLARELHRGEPEESFVCGLLHDIGKLVLAQVSPADYEAIMHFLYEAARYMPVKTTEGHHFKRVVVQRTVLEQKGLPVPEWVPLNGTYHRLVQDLEQVVQERGLVAEANRVRRAPLHVNSADGFVFISQQGDVCPSGYLPVPAGNIRETPLETLYRDSELFLTLRDKSQLKGRCGRCEYRAICGGSRSRAYGVTGDLLAEEPYCTYEAGTFPFQDEAAELLSAGGSR